MPGDAAVDPRVLEERLHACLRAIRECEDEVEREALARALGELVADRLAVLRVVRSHALRELLAQPGMTYSMAELVTGLSRARIAKLARQGDAPVVVEPLPR